MNDGPRQVPRGNIELAQAVADEGSADLFSRYRTLDPPVAPVNSREEFLVFCGVLGLGRLLAEGELEQLGTLRGFASDPRWRAREAVAMALQRLGDINMPALITEMRVWSAGNRLEQRAAALPGGGLKRMEKWFAVADSDVRWIMGANLKKNRPARVDPGWVETWKAQLRVGS